MPRQKTGNARRPYLQHLTKCLSPASLNSGFSLKQRSFAYGQREAKEQPSVSLSSMELDGTGGEGEYPPLLIEENSSSV